MTSGISAATDFCRFWCHLLKTFANSLDPYLNQVGQNVGPDLEPNCLKQFEANILLSDKR